jgi:hypothetical protein
MEYGWTLTTDQKINGLRTRRFFERPRTTGRESGQFFAPFEREKD